MLDPNRDREKELANFVRWAEGQPQVRAAILTSTLAVPGAAVDILSDYDIILALEDIQPFFQSRAWLSDFGPLLAVYRDPVEMEEGFPKSGYVVQYEDGLKIDFTLWPVGLLQQIAAAPQLPEEMDAGYRLLIDKDHLADGLKPPTYRAYIPQPPTEERFREQVENFFLDSGYVAKFLWRGDLLAARHILENFMIQENLRPILEWHIEIERGWNVKPGPYFRGIKKWLRPDLYAALESTLTGPSPEENWGALFRAIDLMRLAATEVAAHLGFAYPEDLDRRAVQYLQKVKDLPR